MPPRIRFSSSPPLRRQNIGHWFGETRKVTLLASLCIIAGAACRSASAQRESVWRGVSRCVDVRHPCNDEQVIYRLAPSSPDTSRRDMDAGKLVGSDTVNMGRLVLAMDRKSGTWVGMIPVGTWRFRIVGDSLVGFLTLTDGSVMRRVTAAQVRTTPPATERVPLPLWAHVLPRR